MKVTRRAGCNKRCCFPVSSPPGRDADGGDTREAWPFTLPVSKVNPAQKLYERLGFAISGKRQLTIG
jgi:hypothetical protein